MSTSHKDCGAVANTTLYINIEIGRIISLASVMHKIPYGEDFDQFLIDVLKGVAAATDEALSLVQDNPTQIVTMDGVDDGNV